MMRGPRLSLLIWTLVLLLCTSTQGLVQPHHGPQHELLFRRGPVLSKPADIKFVLRGERGRTPEDVERAGGIFSRGVQKQRNGLELSTQEIERGSSLYYHARGSTAEFTRYVSTTTDSRTAFQFAIDHFDPNKVGYVYRIAADEKIVDLNKSLGKYSPYAVQQEQAVVGFVPYKQIRGWNKVTVRDMDKPDFFKKLQSGKLEGFETNPKFDESFLSKTAGGAQPQLASFPPESPAWNESPWKRFRQKPVGEHFSDVVGKVCEGGRLARRDVSCASMIGREAEVVDQLGDRALISVLRANRMLESKAIRVSVAKALVAKNMGRRRFLANKGTSAMGDQRLMKDLLNKPALEARARQAISRKLIAKGLTRSRGRWKRPRTSGREVRGFKRFLKRFLKVLDLALVLDLFLPPTDIKN